MSETHHRGVLRVSLGLLGEMLHFPEGHRALDVRPGGTFRDQYFEVLVEGPSLPETPIGEQAPEIDYAVSVEEQADKLVPEKKFSGVFKAAR